MWKILPERVGVSVVLLVLALVRTDRATRIGVTDSAPVALREEEAAPRA